MNQVHQVFGNFFRMTKDDVKSNLKFILLMLLLPPLGWAILLGIIVFMIVGFIVLFIEDFMGE